MEKETNLIDQVMKYDSDLKQKALYFTHNEEDAADLVQETYLKVLQSTDKFAKDTNLKAWAFTILHNTFINGYRRKKRRQTMFDETPESRMLNSATNASDAADMHYYVSDISNKISSIREDQRLPFEMFLDGYKYQEIADAMGIAMGTVKSRIFLIRQKLMSILADYATTDTYIQSA